MKLKTITFNCSVLPVAKTRPNRKEKIVQGYLEQTVEHLILPVKNSELPFECDVLTRNNGVLMLGNRSLIVMCNVLSVGNQLIAVIFCVLPSNIRVSMMIDGGLSSVDESLSDGNPILPAWSLLLFRGAGPVILIYTLTTKRAFEKRFEKGEKRMKKRRKKCMRNKPLKE